MNLQCVPGWDLDDPAAAPGAAGLNPGSAAEGTHRRPGPTGTGGAFLPVVVPMADQYYEVAELTWEKGSISSHGLLNRPAPKYPPATPPQLHATRSGAGAGAGAGGDRETLEAVVGEAAARSGQFARPIPHAPWFGVGVVGVGAVATAGAPADALVPCARDEAAADGDEAAARRNKRARVVEGENGLVCASQGSAAPGHRGESTLLTIEASATAADDVCGITTTTNNSTSLEREDDKGSLETENTSIGGGASDSRYFSRLSQRDGLCDEEDNMVINGEAGMRSSVSTKRSRAAAIHNESERKRRDRINQKMKTLQKLVPNSRKADKASMLDEVIDYLKQLQAQVQVISRMSSMMVPMGMAMPQLQMSIMAQMSHMAQMAQMAQGMMNMGSLAQPGYPGLVPPMMHPPPFVPTMSSWDAATAAAASSTTAAAAGASTGANRAQQPAAGSTVPDAFSAFIASQAQQNGQQQLLLQEPSTVKAHNRMVAMYQKMNQQQQQSQPRPSNHKQ